MQLFHPLSAATLASKTSDGDDWRTKKEQEKLKEACQQFESILLAELWKKMASNARKLGGKDDSERHFGPLEDLSMEMSAEYLSKSGGAGMWKMLYDSLAPHLEAGEKDKGAPV